MRTAHFRGNGVENIDFQRLDQTFSNAPQVILAVLSNFVYCALAQDIRVQRHAARTGAIKGAWESDAFACDFGQRCLCLTSPEHF